MGRDSSVGIATRYGLDGPWIECRSHWPSGLRRVSTVDRLLGLRVRFPPGAWMFVLCVLYSKDKRQSQDNQDKEVRISYRQKKNPGKGEIFRTRPDRPWGPPSLLYNGYRVSLPGVKRPRRGVNHPLPSNVWTLMACSRANFTFTLLLFSEADELQQRGDSFGIQWWRYLCQKKYSLWSRQRNATGDRQFCVT